MQAVRNLLTDAGYDISRYREESFSFTSGDPAPAPPEPVLARPVLAHPGFTVLFAASNRAIACPPDTPVLAAARAAGLRLPFACNKGVCGTCKSRMLSGAVEMTHGGGIRQREIDAGMILLCCARPTSDLVVER